MNIQQELIEIVASAAERLGIDIMLIGAFARDYWSGQFNFQGNTRTTFDVDFSCQVVAWNEFEKLFELLKSEYGLLPDTKKNHSLWLRDEISLDLVPCGDIADSSGMISWPPNYETTLCVRGYDVAKQDAEIVVFGTHSVKVVKPYWLALLKLQSFVGNPDDRDRDLQDLYFLIRNYCECIDLEKRLYSADGVDHDLLEVENFDFELAGVPLICRDCRRFDAETTDKIIAFIHDFDQMRLIKSLSNAAKIDYATAKQIIAAFV